MPYVALWTPDFVRSFHNELNEVTLAHSSDLAAKHADQCKYEHGTLLLTDNTVVGQNIARSTWSKEKGEFPAGKWSGMIRRMLACVLPRIRVWNALRGAITL